MSFIMLTPHTVISLLLHAEILGWENKDDKFELEKRTALISDEVDVEDGTKEFGLVWKVTKPAAGGNADAKMFVHTNENAGEVEDLAVYVRDALESLSMDHKKAMFVCFQIAVEGTGRNILIKTAKKESKSNIKQKVKMNAAFTGRRKSG